MTLRNLRQELSKQEFFGIDDSDIHAVYRVEEHDIVLDQAEKFYLQIGMLHLSSRLLKIVLRVIFVLRR